jgi:hypothetical protein
MDYYNYAAPSVPTIVYPNTTAGIQQQNQQVTQCPLDNRFMWVQTKEIAKTNPMAPDKTILYLDENNPYVYLRRTDREGRTSEFRVFKLIEEKEPEPKVTTPIPDNVVSKEEFEHFSTNISNALSALTEKIDSLNKNNYKPYNKDKRQVREDG